MSKPKFIPFEVFDGQTNMDKDKALLNRSIEQSLPPALRFYGWSNPTVTIGRNQSDNSVCVDFCNKNRIGIIRRITGGRAVLHHKELTYSFIVNKNFLHNGNSVINSYKEISLGLVLGFGKLGLELDYPENKKVFPENGYCMAVSTGSDLSYNGQKLIGSAQCRMQDYILQHGSILLDLDRSMLYRVFGDENVDSEVITLSEINPKITLSDVTNALKSGFEECFGVKFL